MSSNPTKTFFPKTRLQELATQPGSIGRDIAIEAVMANVESMRGQCDVEIESSIAAVEALIADAHGNELAEAEMQKILCYADQIVTLAGTFGYASLDAVVRSLCDLTDGLICAGMRTAAPIEVHVRAMRLMAPGSAPLAVPQAEHVIAELAKVLAHFGFSPLSSAAEANSPKAPTTAN